MRITAHAYGFTRMQLAQTICLHTNDGDFVSIYIWSLLLLLLLRVFF